MPELLLEAKSVSYIVKRNPRRRSVSLEVHPGGIILRVPQRFANRHIPHILRQHAAWLLHRLAELEGARMQTQGAAPVRRRVTRAFSAGARRTSARNATTVLKPRPGGIEH